MDATSEVNIDLGAIEGIDDAVMRALHKTAEALHTEVVQAQVVPFRTGNLQNESSFVDDTDLAKGSVSLVYNTPYARRLYYHPEFRFWKGENPNAQGLWLKRWLEGGSEADFARTAFQMFLEQERGGQE